MGPNTSNIAIDPKTIKVLSDAQCQVTIPATAVTGQLSVSNSAGAAWWYETPFTVTGATAPPVTPPSGGGTSPTEPTPTNANDSYATAAMNGVPGLGIKIAGGKFVDLAGNPFYPRGANFSGMEFVPVDGFDLTDPTGGQGGQVNGPSWTGIKNWKFNIMRLPLAEGSVLGLTGLDSDGVSHVMDPGGNVVAFIDKFIADANAAGIIVIADLHWASPNNPTTGQPIAAMLQTQMADADHSIDFWKFMANRYKNNPAVCFELFNEPFLNFEFAATDTTDPDAAWKYLMAGTGGVFTGLPESSASSDWKDVKFNWSIAPYSTMLSAIRAIAPNVCIIGSMNYSSDLSKWLQYAPKDPTGQTACAVHLYPTYQAPYSDDLSAPYCQPNYSPEVWTYISAIIAAGIPVMVTETGSQNTNGTASSGIITNVTTFADEQVLGSMGCLAWTFDIWGDGANVLCKDGYNQTLTAADTAKGATMQNLYLGWPTDGEGEAWFNWCVNHK